MTSIFLSFRGPLGIYHLISHRWEALAPPTHAFSHACKYAHTLISLSTSIIKVTCTHTHLHRNLGHQLQTENQVISICLITRYNFSTCSPVNTHCSPPSSTQIHLRNPLWPLTPPSEPYQYFSCGTQAVFGVSSSFTTCLNPHSCVEHQN